MTRFLDPREVVLLLLVFAFALTASCGPAASSHPREVLVFGAASLTDSFAELGRAFQQSRPQVTVKFNLAGSQQLALQLSQGARADVFASADLKSIESIKDLQASPAQTFARNKLAIILPSSNPAKVKELRDLAQPRLKLDIAGPSVPVGAYWLQALDKIAASPTYGAHFKAALQQNVVSQETDVKQVVAKVLLGEADAGVVYTTDAAAAGSKVITLSIPDDLNVSAAYPIVVLKNAPEPDLGEEFVGFVMSAEGQAILRQYGFSSPTSAAVTAPSPDHPPAAATGARTSRDWALPSRGLTTGPSGLESRESIIGSRLAARLVPAWRAPSWGVAMRPPNSARYEILGFLLTGPRYGYDLYQEFSAPEGLGQVWHLGMSLMYAELNKLEAEGLVRATVEFQEMRPPKKVFAITARGRRAFRAWMDAPAQGLRELRVEFMVRLFFARRTGVRQVARLITRQIESLRREQEDLLAAAQPEADFAGAVRQFRIGQIQAALQWLEAQRRQPILVEMAQKRRPHALALEVRSPKSDK